MAWMLMLLNRGLKNPDADARILHLYLQKKRNGETPEDIEKWLEKIKKELQEEAEA